MLFRPTIPSFFQPETHIFFFWPKDSMLLHADSEDWANAQADPNLCRAHMSFCWFCHAVAQMCCLKYSIFFGLSLHFDVSGLPPTTLPQEGNIKS